MKVRQWFCVDRLLLCAGLHGVLLPGDGTIVASQFRLARHMVAMCLCDETIVRGFRLARCCWTSSIKECCNARYGRRNYLRVFGRNRIGLRRPRSNVETAASIADVEPLLSRVIETSGPTELPRLQLGAPVAGSATERHPPTDRCLAAIGSPEAPAPALPRRQRPRITGQSAANLPF
jgi:hypothetical protein